jgi:hypothetical protein
MDSQVAVEAVTLAANDNQEESQQSKASESVTITISSVKTETNLDESKREVPREVIAASKNATATKVLSDNKDEQRDNEGTTFWEEAEIKKFVHARRVLPGIDAATPFPVATYRIMKPNDAGLPNISTNRPAVVLAEEVKEVDFQTTVEATPIDSFWSTTRRGAHKADHFAADFSVSLINVNFNMRSTTSIATATSAGRRSEAVKETRRAFSFLFDFIEHIFLAVHDSLKALVLTCLAAVSNGLFWVFASFPLMVLSAILAQCEDIYKRAEIRVHRINRKVQENIAAQVFGRRRSASRGYSQ